MYLFRFQLSVVVFTSLCIAYVAGLEDGGIYTVQVMVEDDVDDCNDMYLAYDYKSNSTRPFLMSRTAERPMRWELKRYEEGIYSLEAVDRSWDRPGKLSYPPQCNQKSCKVSNRDRLRWMVEEAMIGEGGVPLYKMTAIKDCSGQHRAILAPAALSNQGTTCLRQRSLNLLRTNTNYDVYWKFVDVENPTAEPSTSTPDPQPTDEPTGEPTPTPSGEGLEDGGIYTVQVMVEDDVDDCNDMYLAYDYKSNSTRPFLMSRTAERPMRWELKRYEEGIYSLEAVDRSWDRPGKLSYPPQCNQKSCKVSNRDRLRWMVEEAMIGEGGVPLYKMTAIKDCSGQHRAILAPAALSNQGTTCLRQRSLNLLRTNTNYDVYWKFVKV